MSHSTRTRLLRLTPLLCLLTALAFPACSLSNWLRNSGIANSEKQNSENETASNETETQVSQGSGSKTTIFNVTTAGWGAGGVGATSLALLALSRSRHRKALQAVCTEIERLESPIAKGLLKGRIKKATACKGHGRVLHSVVKGYPKTKTK